MVDIIIKVFVNSFVYPVNVLLILFDLFPKYIASPCLFPVTRNVAKKNTPRINQELIFTLIKYAPDTALNTKFVDIVNISAINSCFRTKV